MSLNRSQSGADLNFSTGANDAPPTPGGCAPERPVIYLALELKELSECLVTMNRHMRGIEVQVNAMRRQLKS